MDIRWGRAATQAAGALVLAGTVGSLAATAGSGPAHAPAHAPAVGAAHGGGGVYGITNLAPPPVFRAFINARSQVAFEYTGPDDSPHVGFYDGRRVLDVDPPGALGSLLGGLNDRGEVAAHTLLEAAGTFMPFRWTAAAGPVFLPDPHPDAGTFTNDINNRGQIAGFSQVVDLAARWDGANRIVPLQVPAGYSQSIAFDINESNVSAGEVRAPDGAGHAVLWDAAGRLVDLGTFGTGAAFARFINNRNEVALSTVTPDAEGSPRFRAALWSRRAGVAFVTSASSQSFIAALNERGEAAGRLLPDDAGRLHAFHFSRGRGLVDLHREPFVESSAADINDRGTIVGSMTRANPDGSETELAFRWSNFVPVNLNTRLIHAPAGLVLTQALGIGPSGDIVAGSNAGLVLLRPGGAGSDAPVLGPVTLDDAIHPNAATTLTQTFADRNLRDTHLATVDWGDGSGRRQANLQEHKGRGRISATHTYASAGVFTITVRVTDSGGKTTSTYRNVRVEEPRPLAGGAHSSGAGAKATGVRQQRKLLGPDTPAAVQAWVERLGKK